MKILVIEDDPAFQVLVCCIVKTAVSGLLDLVVAENVSEAQAALDENVDLVISDYDFGGGGLPRFVAKHRLFGSRLRCDVLRRETERYTRVFYPKG